MALQLIVDSIEAVPENARDLYKEVDGKFRLDLDGYEDPVGLKSALQKEREAAKSAAKRASAWESFGKTPEEIQEVLAAQLEAEDQKLRAEKKFEELDQKKTERMRLEHDKQIQAREETIAKQAAIIQKANKGRVAGELTKAALKAGALPDAIPSIVLQGIHDGWTVDDNGDLSALQGGEVVFGKDGRTKLSKDEWAEGLRDATPFFFPKAQGTGAPGASGNPNFKPSTADWSKASTKERVALLKAKNPNL